MILDPGFVAYAAPTPEIALDSTLITPDGLINAAEIGNIAISGTTTGVEPGQTIRLTFRSTNAQGQATEVRASTTASASGLWSVSGVDLRALDQGSVTLDVRVSNAANYEASTSTSALIDTVAPAAGTLSLVNLDDTGAADTDFITQDRDLDLNITGQEAGASVAYEVSVNGGPWTATSAAQRNLADASYSFRATITDTAGNQSIGNTVQVTVDTGAPAAGVLSLLGFDDSGASSTDFISQDRDFDLHIADQEGSASVAFEVSVNGGPWTATTATQRNLADASYAFRAIVTDTAGTRSIGNTVQVTVDTSAPAAASINRQITTDNRPLVTGLAVMGNGESAEVWINGQRYDASNGLGYAVQTGVWSMRAGFLSSNIYTVRVVITDLAGNSTETLGQLIIGAVPSHPTPATETPRARDTNPAVPVWQHQATTASEARGDARAPDTREANAKQAWGAPADRSTGWSQPGRVSAFDLSAGPTDDGYVSTRQWLDRWASIGTTLTSGFAVLVNDKATELAVYKGVGDLRVVLGQLVTVDIPGDAFVHHNPNAEVTLEISSLDDSPLPSWIRLDPRTGRLTINAPADAVGDWTIRLVARDQFGNSAVTVFHISLGRPDAASAGRPSLSDKLAQARASGPTLVATRGVHGK